MSIETILAETFHVCGTLLKASFKLAKASAAVMEVTAASIESWAERAQAKNDISTIEEWNKITPPSQKDIDEVRKKVKASKEASDELNAKL